ncbi:MAG: glycosyltransferase family 4 protein [Acidobacteriota bacterium]
MKVAMLSHLASPTAPTGAEHSLAVLAEGLVHRGHEVSVAAPGPWALAAELESGGVEVTTIPVRACWLVQYGPQPLARQLVRAARWAAPDPGEGRLRSWLERSGADVVHVNCLPHVRGAAAGRSAGIPVVWHVREILPPGARRRWFARRLRRDATRVVAVSAAVAEWLAEEGLGDLVEVVHNGVEVPSDQTDRVRARKDLGLPPDGIVIGLFSQLVEHKGALDFLAAAHAAAAREPTVRFLMAGHGPEKFLSRLQGEISRGAGAGRIHLVRPQETVWPLLAASDAIALTTLWPDPLPRVVMEAMAAGLPVIAYRGGGVPEMVVDGESGLLVDTGDREALADAMLDLARNPRLRAALGQAGRARAQEMFSVDRHVERVEAVLADAASARGPAG